MVGGGRGPGLWRWERSRRGKNLMWRLRHDDGESVYRRFWWVCSIIRRRSNQAAA